MNFKYKEINLGKLKIGEKIGQGGFGIVHEASLQGLSTPLAIKFLFPSAFQSPKAKSFDRFLREAQALYSLRHQYIPTIFGLGKDESMPFILMEYFKNGQNLQKIREKKENPNPLKVMIFFRRIAEALALAHDSGWVHRDHSKSVKVIECDWKRVL